MLFIRDCGCPRLRWFHDEAACNARREEQERAVLENLWRLDTVEEPYDWELSPNEDDQ